jgi:phosphate transport system substrate-binding protein
LKGAESAPAPEQDSSGMVRSIVASTPGAISYVAFSYADNTVTEVSVDDVKPTVKNVTTNTWKIWAYEHVYTKGQPKGQVAAFLKYLQSEKIQNTVVPQLGYISIHDMHVSRTADGKIVNK